MAQRTLRSYFSQISADSSEAAVSSKEKTTDTSSEDKDNNPNKQDCSDESEAHTSALYCVCDYQRGSDPEIPYQPSQVSESKVRHVHHMARSAIPDQSNQTGIESIPGYRFVRLVLEYFELLVVVLKRIVF